MPTAPHEQSAQVNEVVAVSPAQTEVVPVDVRLIGGPPPAHIAGAGPSATSVTQLPALQPVPVGQTTPQAPQLEELFWRSTQVPLQAVRGGGQLDAQAFDRQTWVGLQAMAQPPQFLGSTVVSVQTPLQSVSWLGQAQAPALQYSPPVQAMPQPPQFAESVWGFTHFPPQTMSPVVQQTPGGVAPVARHELPVAHDAPQAPQFVLDEERSTQTPEQSVSPVGQPQTPAEQTSPPVQLLPQAPQLDELVARLVQTPLQFVRPAPQQRPLWQVAPVGQATMQLPQ